MKFFKVFKSAMGTIHLAYTRKFIRTTSKAGRSMKNNKAPGRYEIERRRHTLRYVCMCRNSAFEQWPRHAATILQPRRSLLGPLSGHAGGKKGYQRREREPRTRGTSRSDDYEGRLKRTISSPYLRFGLVGRALSTTSRALFLPTATGRQQRDRIDDRARRVYYIF